MLFTPILVSTVRDYCRWVYLTSQNQEPFYCMFLVQNSTLNSLWSTMRLFSMWCLTSKCLLWYAIIFCWLNLKNFPYNYMLLSSLWVSSRACLSTLLLVSQSRSLIFSTPCQTRIWHLTQIDKLVKCIMGSNLFGKPTHNPW